MPNHYDTDCPHCHTNIADEDSHVCRGVVRARTRDQPAETWPVCVGGQYDRVRHPYPDVEYRLVRLTDTLSVWVHHTVTTLQQAMIMMITAYDRESTR